MFSEPKKPDPRNTDPAPSDRVYYRHTETGDRGYLVVRDGEQRIRYDQPMMDRTVKFNPGMWKPDHQNVPFTLPMIAQVAFEADKTLCRQLGLHKESRADWLLLRDQERIEFMGQGPPGPEPRRRLFRAIMGALSELTK